MIVNCGLSVVVGQSWILGLDTTYKLSQSTRLKSMPAPTSLEMAVDVVKAYIPTTLCERVIYPISLSWCIPQLRGWQRNLNKRRLKPPQLQPCQSAGPSRRTYLICLEDGKRFKSLRRHLGVLGLTPEQYRRNGTYLLAILWLRQTMRPSGRFWRKRSGLVGCARRGELTVLFLTEKAGHNRAD